MHFDLAHAIVAVCLIYGSLAASRWAGIIGEHVAGKWDWRVFGVVFVVMANFNLIWPYG